MKFLLPILLHLSVLVASLQAASVDDLTFTLIGDVDGDGNLDVNEDIDGDGNLDVAEDIDGNGILTESYPWFSQICWGCDVDRHMLVEEDIDRDGNLDVAEDINGNGTLDPGEDIDGDGNLDVNEDIDGNGMLSESMPWFHYQQSIYYGNGAFLVPEDIDGDGNLDVNEDIDGDGRLDVAEYFGYSVTDCLTTASGSLVIPSIYEGLPVTSIGDYAFTYCTSLTSITIPDSVTSIGEGAFDNCRGLSSIVIGDGVTSIGKYAFVGCTSLTSVNIPDSVTSIGDGAFQNCTNLTSINIPDSVTSIGEGAFAGCSNLTSITIPDSVTSIGFDAFRSCTDLASITIPDSVTSIRDGAFYDCTSLASITIGNSVTSIGTNAFYQCTSLTSITIPDSVTSIGQYAFQGCSSLESITIPDGVTFIGDNAFYVCSELTSITLPYKFAGSASLFGIPEDAEITVNFDDVSEGLLANTNFVAGISEEVTFDSSAVDQAIADEAQARADADASIQADIDQNELDSVAADADLQQQIIDLQTYIDNAVTQARSEGVTAGIQAVTSDPQSYQLYSESSILEMNVSNPTFSMLNESEQAQVEFTLETSTDLEGWNIEERIQRTVEATGDKFFVRIQSGTPYVTPTVVTYNHPTYGNILTDGSGNVLYGFSIDSVGGDPLYSGSAWPLATHSTDPEPDADVTAELTRGTYSITSGGPWLKINNRPVYTYVGDSEPNQASGHGLGSVWFTIKPDGTLNQ